MSDIEGSTPEEVVDRGEYIGIKEMIAHTLITERKRIFDILDHYSKCNCGKIQNEHIDLCAIRVIPKIKEAIEKGLAHDPAAFTQ